MTPLHLYVQSLVILSGKVSRRCHEAMTTFDETTPAHEILTYARKDIADFQGQLTYILKRLEAVSNETTS